jgi:nucleotide-binding universal stress UspA family protein
MFDTILFPTDGSGGSEATFDHAIALADAHDATLHVLNVADTTVDSVTQIQGEVIDTLEHEGERIVDEAAERAHERGVSTVAEVLQGEPYRTIVDYAPARDVDLIVMPTHGRRGLERFLLGSTTERVVRLSEVPVLTVRPDEDVTVRYPYRNVLVPTDGSDPASAALELALDVVRVADADLHLLSMVDVASLGIDVRTDLALDSLERSANEILEVAATTAAEAGVTPATKRVDFGTSVTRTVCTEIDERDVDLVVVGTHGRTGLERYVLGSVTEKLVRMAPVPVLTVRSDQQAE